MTRPTDEMLMAYADSELSVAETARISAELEADAEARAAVESFRRTAALARAAFSEVMSEPVPHAVIRTVLGSEARSPVVADLPHRRKWPRPRSIALPLAASLAILAGIGATFFMLRSPTVSLARTIELGPVQPATPLADLLETRPSGSPIDFAGRDGEDSERMMAVATFRDRNNRVCREIEVLEKAMQPRTAGVACRDPDRGTWTVEGAARLVAPHAPSGTGYVPSGAAEKDALEGLLNVLGAKRALTAEEEQRLIEKGWR